MIRFVLTAFAILCFGSSDAQVLSWESVRQQVLQEHPVSRQANLMVEISRAAILRAKGGFDAKLFSSHTAKNFEGKNYFNYSEAGVKWPIRAGLEVKGAYNLASGKFVNPESTLPENGQAVLGLEWTLLQGLFYDERRANLDAARVDLDFNNAQRVTVQNDLLLEVAKVYWNWVFAEAALDITQNALQQAVLRHDGLRESFFQGDKPAIDTLETFIQLQTRQIDFQFAQTDLQNAEIALANYLWTNAGQTVAPDALGSAPDILSLQGAVAVIPDLDQLVLQSGQTHPDIQQYRSKLKLLDVERRLKREKLKPVANINYNLLGNAWSFFPSADASGPAILANDIKWGVEVQYPILNRKARGDLQMNQLKIAQTDLQLQQKTRDITAKIQQYNNEAANLRAQVETFQRIVDNYRRLLDAEIEKFGQGESSIFLINTREQRWLEAQIKWWKLMAELQKTEAALLWAAGKLAA